MIVDLTQKMWLDVCRELAGNCVFECMHQFSIATPFFFLSTPFSLLCTLALERLNIASLWSVHVAASSVCKRVETLSADQNHEGGATLTRKCYDISDQLTVKTGEVVACCVTTGDSGV